MRPIYLLDTNVISEFSKPLPNCSLAQKVADRIDFCAISSCVWQETIQGYESMPEGKRKSKLANYVDKIKETYEIIPYDEFAAQICGEIRSKCERAGRPLPYMDSQIAATAIANGMILITHNTQDFEVLQENSMLKVEDWWA